MDRRVDMIQVLQDECMRESGESALFHRDEEIRSTELIRTDVRQMHDLERMQTNLNQQHDDNQYL